MSDYMPPKDGELDSWEGNFHDKIENYKTTLGLQDSEVLQAKDVISRHRTSYTNMIDSKNETKAKVSECKNLKNAMRAYIRPLVQRIKNHPNYTDSIGKDLDIIGPKTPVNWDEVKPELRATVEANKIRIDFKKFEADGIKIYSKRGAEQEFSFLAYDTIPPYYDTRPNPEGVRAEERQYYAVYILNDDVVGQMSDIVRVKF